MRTFIKKITHPLLKSYYKRLEKKEHKYSYNGINIIVYPAVFSPKLTISTKILLEFLDKLELTKKSFLELGAGCGIISFYADNKGAIVTASDISEYAIEGLEKNKKALNSSVEIVKSNLLDNLNNRFDVIVINPPYYPKTPKNVAEKAWFCGENFEYFEALFSSLSKVLKPDTEVYMILSEDCKIERIKEIAQTNNYEFLLKNTEKKFGEKNFIFKITNK